MSASTQPAPAPSQPLVEPAPLPALVPPPGPKEPRRWKWLAALVFGALLSGSLYLMLRPGEVSKVGSGGGVHTAAVTTGPIERIVRISGQTSARRFATVMVPVFRGPDSGQNLTLMNVAKPGSFVKKGDRVAEFDPQSLRDLLDDLGDMLQQADNDIAKKRANQEVEWEALQQRLRVAKADVEKARLDQKAAEVMTTIERELIKLAADEAEAAYKQLQRDVENTRISNQAEIRMLEITAQRHTIHRNNHSQDINKFLIKAPMDGLVVMLQTFRNGEQRTVQEGDQVFPGQQFMKIVDPASMQVEAVVSQADSSQFRVGQTASIGLDAFPDVRLRGRIYSIGALAVKGIWDTYYIRNIPVRITIEGRDPRLIPDLSAWAHVPIERQDSAMLVPTEAVHVEAGAPFVFVRNGTGFEKRPVDIGVRTPTLVSVLSGVRPGERVALEPVK